MAPVRLADGTTLGAEVKTRRRLPRLILAALEQAQSYFPGAIPIAVVSELGGRAIVCLDLRAFAKLVGLDVSKLPRPRRSKRSAKQLELVLRVAGGAVSLDAEGTSPDECRDRQGMPNPLEDR